MTISASLIEQHLNAIIGQPVMQLGRAGNMMEFCIGTELEYALSNGEKRILNRYILHLQCAWKIVSPREILISGRDFYQSVDGLSFSGNDSWDKPGNNLFDVKAEKFNLLLSEESVKINCIRASNYGDFSIQLSNMYELHVFIDNSAMEEYWRLIDYTSSPSNHFVVFANE